MLLRWSCTIFSFTLLVAGGCQPSVSPVGAHAMRQGMYGGSPDTGPGHIAVVALTEGTHGYFCSGTLITEDVVLTAAHCLEETSVSSMRVFFGNDVDGDGDHIAVNEALPNPGYDGWNLTGDIALIRMSGPAPTGVVPIPHLPAAVGLTSADVGAAIEFCGFGVTPTGSEGVKLKAPGVIEVVCSGNNACSLGGNSVVPRSFGYYMDPAGPCTGDSGGPAFILRGGQEYIAGVTSYGDAWCQEYGVNTTVSEYAPWIDAFLGAPTAEDCTNGTDDDDDDLADCLDPDCAAAPACQDNACQGAATVTCGTQQTLTTADGVTIFERYSCLSRVREEGPELGFELAIPAGTPVSVQVTPLGSSDLDLFLLAAAGASCGTEQCLQVSAENGPAQESMQFTMPAGGAFIVVDTWDQASSFEIEVLCPGVGDAGQPDLPPVEDARPEPVDGGPGADGGTGADGSAGVDGDLNIDGGDGRADDGCGCAATSGDRELVVWGLLLFGFARGCWRWPQVRRWQEVKGLTSPMLSGPEQRVFQDVPVRSCPPHRSSQDGPVIWRPGR